jgi:hypothetical protein
MTNIYKLASTLLREFDLTLAASEDRRAESEGQPSLGNMPELISVSVSDMKHPLMVRARKRIIV